MLNLVMFESEMNLLVIDCDIQLIYDHESSNSSNFHRGLCVYTLIYLFLCQLAEPENLDCRKHP